MVEYGCNVANKYGFYSDDDDCDDPNSLAIKVAKHEEKVAAAKKAEKEAADKAAALPEKKDAAKPAVGKENRPATGERGRGGRGRGRGGPGGERGDRPPRVPRDEMGDRFGEGGRGRGAPRGDRPRGAPRPFRGRGGNANTGSDEHHKETPVEDGTAPTGDAVASPEEGFRRGGRGGFRGGPPRERGGRGNFRGRMHDRHSGAEHDGGVKKDGHGKGNWGTAKDELAGETEPTGENVEVKEAEPVVPREPTAEELALEAERAEIAKQKTLKEFKAAMKADEPKFNVRKAGEGGSANFGKLRPLQKEIINDKEEEEIVIVRREPRRQVLNIDIQFTDPARQRDDHHGGRGGDRPRGGRGGRGAPRGGPRGGGGGRGGARQGGAAPFDASSNEAFPALGAK